MVNIGLFTIGVYDMYLLFAIILKSVEKKNKKNLRCSGCNDSGLGCLWALW